MIEGMRIIVYRQVAGIIYVNLNSLPLDHNVPVSPHDMNSHPQNPET